MSLAPIANLLKADAILFYSTYGNKAVTEIGMASVIHQIAIHIVEARIALALGFKPSG